VAASVSWAIAAVLGLQVALAQAAGVYRIFELLGGLYLCWIGVAMWRGAPGELPSAGPELPAASSPFRKGLTLGLSNPKVIVFFGTIFTTAFAVGTPGAVKWAAVLVVFCVESFWYTTLALCFGVPPVRRAWQKLKARFERVFGGLLFAFGAKLAWGGLRGS
jgi:threonine/homoserine/homoserine lactone efflux protein